MNWKLSFSVFWRDCAKLVLTMSPVCLIKLWDCFINFMLIICALQGISPFHLSGQIYVCRTVVVFPYCLFDVYKICSDIPCFIANNSDFCLLLFFFKDLSILLVFSKNQHLPWFFSCFSVFSAYCSPIFLLSALCFVLLFFF